MNLLEYQAKQLLAASGLPVPRGQVVQDIAAITVPVVLKSQVPIGGRGKLGGIQIVDSQTDLSQTYHELLDREIKGYKPDTIYAEELLAIDRELYLSIGVDRTLGAIQLVAHPVGGVEVEDSSPADFYRHIIERPSDIANFTDSLADHLDLAAHSHHLADIVTHLYDRLVTGDATLIEINPLVVTRDSTLVAGDCKLTLDDAAIFRHPEWSEYQLHTDHNFVTLDPLGTVATIANGAGLAMATVDAVYSRGLQPANFLDIGGGASVTTILEAFRDIMEFPRVTHIVINIFGGIVRCDDVARAILAARQQIDDLPTLHIRLSGTNSREAAELLSASGLPLHPDLNTLMENLS